MNQKQYENLSPEQKFKHHRRTRTLTVRLGQQDNVRVQWFNDPNRGQIVCMRHRAMSSEGYWVAEVGIAKLNPKEADAYNILEGAKISLERAITNLERDERKLVWDAFHKKFGVIKR